LNSPTRFAVLAAGWPPVELREIWGDYARMTLSLLRRPGDTWVTFDATRCRYPDSLQAFDGYVITGSASTAFDDLEWILLLKETTRRIYEHGIPQVGICFGHQVLAEALGGRVARNAQGWEVGLHEVRLASQLSREINRDRLHVLQMHRDHVVELPAQAEVLGVSDRSAVQIYRLHNRILGIQGHPEFESGLVAELIDERRRHGILSEEVAREGLSSLSTQTHEGAVLGRVARRFLEATP